MVTNDFTGLKKCTRCGTKLPLQNAAPGSSVGSSLSSQVMMSGATLNMSYDGLYCTIGKGRHSLHGEFCKWDCMMEWIQDEARVRLVTEVLSS